MIAGPFEGVGVLKYIPCEWGVFLSFVRFKLGDGFKIRFDHDL